MHATPSATSPNILRISDSVSLSCNRVFIKSISPPPTRNQHCTREMSAPEQNSMSRKTS
jgi:hypothetical protein